MPYKNLSIEEFKAEAKASSIQIVRSPITQKLFAAVGEQRFKVQGTEAKNGELDVTKPVNFLIVVGGTEENPEPHTADQFKEGCFVNENADNVLLSM